MRPKNNPVFAALFVFLAVVTGWAWHTAQLLGVPLPLRVIVGLAALWALFWWLMYHLEHNGGA